MRWSWQYHNYDLIYYATFYVIGSLTITYISFYYKMGILTYWQQEIEKKFRSYAMDLYSPGIYYT